MTGDPIVVAPVEALAWVQGWRGVDRGQADAYAGQVLAYVDAVTDQRDRARAARDEALAREAALRAEVARLSREIVSGLDRVDPLVRDLLRLGAPAPVAREWRGAA